MGLFRKNASDIDEAIESSINYTSLFQSMDKGQALFNQLRVKCHPDKFVGTNKQLLAEELFKQVQANSTNYEALIALKERIDKDL